MVGRQLLFIGLAALVSFFIDPEAVPSALAGGMICWLPASLFAWQVFRHQGARAAKQIVSAFYRAEAVKLIFTAILFCLAFVLVAPLHPLVLFITFIGTQAVGWMSACSLSHHPKRNIRE